MKQLIENLLAIGFLVAGCFMLLYAQGFVKTHPAVWVGAFVGRALMAIIRIPFLLVGSALKGLGQGTRRWRRP